MKNITYLLLVIFSVSLTGQILGQNLTHEISNEEKALMPAYLQKVKKRAYSAPSGNISTIAEFGPSQGVLVAYPFGIPISLIAEMSEDVMVTTIVDGASQENSVKSTYQSNGVNLNNCNFLYADHDTYWTRDYGPWFIASDNEIGIVDFTYDRPRENDNKIPASLGQMLNVDVYSMNMVQTGGNYMADGISVAAATDLVLEENTSMSQTEINQLMNSYLGVENYHVTDDPLGEYIKHIDCWGKFLDVDKILIAQVPTSNSNYSKYESVAEYFANQTTPYGNKYQVYRVYEPSGQPYTNSLILNNKVLVPISGNSYDEAALQVYKDAMPGYEVIGFTGTWEPTDALHCRTHEIADLGMLHIAHFPLLGEVNYENSYTLTAEITAFSNQSIYADSVKLFYKVGSGEYQAIVMEKAANNTYQATLPAQAAGSKISYYIHAADQSGRSENHPYIGKSDPHVFTIKSTEVITPVAGFTANQTTVSVGKGISFTDLSTNSPTSWVWSFEGGSPSTSTLQNPSVSYSQTGTYTVSLTAGNSAGSNKIVKTGYITVTEAAIEYCSSLGSNYSYEWISNVEIGSFSNTSSGASYTDFTDKTINLTTGKSTTVRLTPGFSSSSYTEYWKVWIDYNNDGDFEDSGENVFSSSGTSAVSGSFTVSDFENTTRMRITMKYNNAPTPCETFSYGEVEDYTVSKARSGQTGIKMISGVNGEENSNNPHVVIYPNPASNNLYVSLGEKNAEIKIINAVGATVDNRMLDSGVQNIDVSQLPTGVYTIMINSIGEMQVRKFIKQ